MHFTLWPGLLSKTGGHAEITWKTFVDFVAAPAIAASKTDLEGWSPAKFTGDERRKTAVELVSAIVLDYDASGKTTDMHAANWASVAGVIHTSFSHTEDAPKHRVVLRCSRDMTLAEQERVWAFVASRSGYIDEVTKDASRLWFVPAHPPGATYAWRELKGEPLDVDAILASTPCPQSVDSSPKPPAASSDRRAAMAAALAAAWPAKGRHEAQLALAGALRAEGFTADEAVDFLTAVAGDRAKRTATVTHTYAKAEGEALTGWTRLKAFVDPVIVDTARAALGRDAALLERLSRYDEPYRDPDVIDPSIKAENPLGIVWGGWDEPAIVPPYLLEGLIPSEKVCTFFAEGGSIKSWVAFELAIAVALGRPWLGEFAVKGPGKVVIADFEDGREEFKRRKQILVRGTNDPLVNLGYRYDGPAMLDPETWIELARMNLTLLIVDSLGAAMPGDADENATAFAAAVKLAGKWTTHTKASVIFIAHANKAGGMRGTGAIRDQSDCAFTFVPVSETEDGEEKRMRLVCDKPGPQKKPKPVNIMLSDRGLITFKDEEAPEPPPEDRARAQILTLLENKAAGVNKQVLLGAIKVKTDIKRQVLDALIVADVVVEFRQAHEVIVMLNAARQRK